VIHLDQFQHVEVSLHGKIRRNKLYRCTCDKCGADRGYKSKCYKAPLCNRCNKSGILLSTQHKEQMSEAAIKRYNDINWIPVDRSKKGHHRNKTRVYKKIKTELQSKFSKNMRCLLSNKLKRRGLSKFRQKTFDILGYSVDDLIKHLESKFQPGMSWENYGKWEIDHIKPDSWFNYDSCRHPDFRESWKLENLRPYWEYLNASDGARLCHKQ
jgi:hypothetical protein